MKFRPPFPCPGHVTSKGMAAECPDKAIVNPVGMKHGQKRCAKCSALQTRARQLRYHHENKRLTRAPAVKRGPFRCPGYVTVNGAEVPCPTGELVQPRSHNAKRCKLCAILNAKSQRLTWQHSRAKKYKPPPVLPSHRKRLEHDVINNVACFEIHEAAGRVNAGCNSDIPGMVASLPDQALLVLLRREGKESVA